MLKTTLKIFKYQASDVIRSRWIIYYCLFYLGLTEILFRFGGNNGSKAVVSLLNITLILVPLVSQIFGTMYLYNSREFIELLLSQPIRRNQLFTGLYFSLTIPMSAAFAVGIGIPALLRGSADLSVFWSLISAGVFLTFIFTGFSFWISSVFEDKATGLGSAFIVWLFFTALYDGIILMFIWEFNDFPLEMPLIALSLLNPVDIGRILVILKFDNPALMGYTGAVFEKFFGSSQGMIISIAAMLVWIIIPFRIASGVFRRKNF